MRRCYVCGRGPDELEDGIEDLRPYGENGQDICFDCMVSDPKREEAAKQRFYKQLDEAGEASEEGIAEIGNPNGPVPVNPTKRST